MRRACVLGPPIRFGGRQTGLSRKGTGGTHVVSFTRLRFDQPASPAVGRGVRDPSCMSFPRKWESSCFLLDCCLRRNDTFSGLRRNDTVAPSPGGAFGTAGLSRGGERRAGLLLARE